MVVIIRGPNYREVELGSERRVEQILRQLGLNPETHIAVRGEELLTRDDIVRENDTIEIISAISGG
ncbi:MAG TPA: MoaD/ThiS family protein [Candidatus Acidoferrales bacterium]|nr:MoaD/ThiS family protein [Candidatus Acidoferrales bacterium]